MSQPPGANITHISNPSQNAAGRAPAPQGRLPHNRQSTQNQSGAHIAAQASGYPGPSSQVASSVQSTQGSGSVNPLPPQIQSGVHNAAQLSIQAGPSSQAIVRPKLDRSVLPFCRAILRQSIRAIMSAHPQGTQTTTFRNHFLFRDHFLFWDDPLFERPLPPWFFQSAHSVLDFSYDGLWRFQQPGFENPLQYIITGPISQVEALHILVMDILAFVGPFPAGISPTQLESHFGFEANLVVPVKLQKFLDIARFFLDCNGGRCQLNGNSFRFMEAWRNRIDVDSRSGNPRTCKHDLARDEVESILSPFCASPQSNNSSSMLPGISAGPALNQASNPQTGSSTPTTTSPPDPLAALSESQIAPFIPGDNSQVSAQDAPQSSNKRHASTDMEKEGGGKLVKTESENEAGSIATEQ